MKCISSLSPQIELYFTFHNRAGASDLVFKMKLGWKMNSRNILNVLDACELQIDFAAFPL